MFHVDGTDNETSPAVRVTQTLLERAAVGNAVPPPTTVEAQPAEQAATEEITAAAIARVTRPPRL